MTDSRFHRRHVPFALFAGLLLLGAMPSAVVAQDDDSDEIAYPLVTVNAARLDRLLDNTDEVFDEIDRPELSESVGAFLANVRDAKGMRRDMPFGMMLYLEPGLTLELAAIMYVPVEDLKDLADTMSRGQGTLREIPDEPDRYEVVTDNLKLQVLHQGNYALITRNQTALDRRFPDVESMALALENRFDLHAALSIQSVPVGMRTVFLSFLQIRAEADLQRRDNEPEAVYRLRKAQGLNSLKSLEQIVNQGREVSFGVVFSHDEHDSYTELRITAVPDSAFAKAIRDSAGKASSYLAMLEDDAAFNIAAAGQLDDHGVVFMNEAVTVGRERLGQELELAHGANSPEAAQIDALWNALRETIDRKDFDMFARFDGNGPGEFAGVVSVKLRGAENLALSIQTLLEELQELLPQQDEKASVETDVAIIEGRPVHRIRVEGPDAGARRVFGDEPALWITNSNRAIWLALGGDSALDQLKDLIREYESPEETPDRSRSRSPMQASARITRWMTLFGESQEEEREFFGNAFRSSNDQIRVESSAIESGVRVRVYLPTGVTRLVGLLIAKALDDAAGI